MRGDQVEENSTVEQRVADVVPTTGTATGTFIAKRIPLHRPPRPNAAKSHRIRHCYWLTDESLKHIHLAVAAIRSRL